ncbi:hypothetical protein GQ53DRAFT_847846 [Thozetella sp. PMI_491]|nr:hypothetical protein GQ53DRAFT_847846 [Thozetella sp. PMI_491]
MFISPPDVGAQISSDPVYYISETINIQWDTDLSSVRVLMYETASGGKFADVVEATSGTNYQWTISLRGLTGTEFYFVALPDTGASFQSHAFEILPASSSGSSTISTSSTPTTTTTAPPNNTSTSASSSTKLSGGAIAGIVVGIVAAFALGGAIVFLFIRRRNPQVSPSQQSSKPENGVSGKSEAGGAIEAQSSAVHELGGDNVVAPSELYGSPAPDSISPAPNHDSSSPANH